ncbi:DUF58 domain-containing protein [Lactiplantibacillus daowaiensis]|uniref:DUF58 domain-containing protein n=1 Tax=Lactiplantibacillus daowaiensis TaxID=2559918 RepID=A0ABW1S3C8_9LACO|nr:DUF58 domain-containing protein [Lactiplantibacillus daowaiensis]
MATLKTLAHNLGVALLLVLGWGYAISFNNATGWALAASLTGIAIVSGLALLGAWRRVTIVASLTTTTPPRLVLTLAPKRWPLLCQPALSQPHLTLQPTGHPRQWQTQLPLPRGVYDQLTVTVRLTDPLHLFVHRQTQTLTTALIVPPVLQPVAAQAVFQQVAPLIHATQPVSAESSGFETQDFRPYQPGDPSNQIDWKLTAKAQTPMLRLLANDEPVPWCWVFCVTTHQDLEYRLATFYTFVQLVGELPAQTLLIGTEQQLSANLMPDAFARYQPYSASQLPTVNVTQRRVLLFGDDSPLTAQLHQQLARQNLQATTIQWPSAGGEHHATGH